MLNFFGSAEKTVEEQAQAVQSLRERLTDGRQPVEEQLRNGGEAGLKEGLDDATLRRWLRAENFDVDEAEARLRSHAEWRSEKFPHGRVREEEIGKELASNKVFLQGCDLHGRRLIVMKVNRHLKSARQLSESMRFLCYALDKAIALADYSKNPEGKICGIFDLRDLTMDSLDSSALRGVFDMLQNHYPERLGTLWMYESPGIFWALWKMVSPFIDPVTRKKVIFVSESSALPELEKDISLEVLPKDFGGKAELEPIQAVGKDESSLEAKSQEATATENGSIMGP